MNDVIYKITTIAPNGEKPLVFAATTEEEMKMYRDAFEGSKVEVYTSGFHMPNMEQVDWNELSRRGLVERINREIMHPLGLAVYYSPESGLSGGALVAEDGIWEYDETQMVKRDKPVVALKLVHSNENLS